MNLGFNRTALVAMALLACSLGMAQADNSDATPKPKAKPGAAAKAPRKASKPKPAKGKQLDVNVATKAELMTIPGFTDAIADKIIAGRPYPTKAHLVTRNVIPMGLFQGIRDRITAIPPAPK
jgi:DNA uptake protein ComE-like DNA-binding protein